MAGGQRTKATKRTAGATRAKEPPRPSPSLKSFSSLAPADGFIPTHGGYQQLLSYQKALVVYDATVYFCERFLSKRDRTYDQMIQAARSGKQNILEGSEASGTSKETEIKLTGVAKASQKELLEDYRDFMRNRGIEEWAPDHRYARRLRQLNRTPGANYQTFKKGIEHPDPAICANVIAGLVKVTCYLLDRQIRRLEQDFLQEGGLRERMTRARLAARAKQQRNGP
ncbi:MAG: four helix bundle suffix domain-containing protein [Verrucomicrobiota bacterium]